MKFKRGLILLSFMLVLMTVVSAEQQTLGSFQVDSTVDLVQYCANSSYSNISRILYPNSTAAISTETIMTASGDSYSYSFSSTPVIGQYIVYGHCDQNGVDTGWAYDFWITSTGDRVSSSNTVLVVIFIALAGLLYLIGLSFNSEHWMLRTFFNFAAVGMGILAANSAKIVASESLGLGTMGTVGLTVMIVTFSLFVLYIFIYMFIENIRSFKKKGDIRWEY